MCWMSQPLLLLSRTGQPTKQEFVWKPVAHRRGNTSVQKTIAKRCTTFSDRTHPCCYNIYPDETLHKQQEALLTSSSIAWKIPNPTHSSCSVTSTCQTRNFIERKEIKMFQVFRHFAVPWNVFLWEDKGMNRLHGGFKDPHQVQKENIYIALENTSVVKKNLYGAIQHTSTSWQPQKSTPHHTANQSLRAAGRGAFKVTVYH